MKNWREAGWNKSRSERSFVRPRVTLIDPSPVSNRRSVWLLGWGLLYKSALKIVLTFFEFPEGVGFTTRRKAKTRTRKLIFSPRSFNQEIKQCQK